MFLSPVWAVYFKVKLIKFSFMKEIQVNYSTENLRNTEKQKEGKIKALICHHPRTITINILGCIIFLYYFLCIVYYWFNIAMITGHLQNYIFLFNFSLGCYKLSGCDAFHSIFIQLMCMDYLPCGIIY